MIGPKKNWKNFTTQAVLRSTWSYPGYERIMHWKPFTDQQLTFIQSKHAKSFPSVSREKKVQNKLLTFDENECAAPRAWVNREKSSSIFSSGVSRSNLKSCTTLTCLRNAQTVFHLRRLFVVGFFSREIGAYLYFGLPLFLIIKD